MLYTVINIHLGTLCRSLNKTPTFGLDWSIACLSEHPTLDYILVLNRDNPTVVGQGDLYHLKLYLKLVPHATVGVYQ